MQHVPITVLIALVLQTIVHLAIQLIHLEMKVHYQIVLVKQNILILIVLFVKHVQYNAALALIMQVID